MRTSAALSLVFLVALPSCRHYRSDLLINPAPVSLTGYGDAARTLIIDSMHAQSWVVSREEPGRIHAIRLVNNKHEMQILLSYDKDSIHMEYEDSKNLAYMKNLFGAEYIHRSYNSWTAALWWEIRQKLSELRTADPG